MTQSWIKLNRKVWAETDRGTTLDITVWLLKTQIEEIETHLALNHSDKQIMNELCDIISLCSRAIERMGYDVNKAMIYRIKHRYENKVQEIIEKYDGLSK